MRVLAVTSMHPTPSFPLRGMIIRRHADAIRALGHQVDFVELGSEGGPLRYSAARSEVAATMECLRPNVIHAHFGYSGLAVPETPVPLVTSFYGDDLNGTATPSGGVTFKSRVGVALSQYVAWRSTRCITVSAALRERLWSWRLREKTTVIRDAVDPGLFRPVPRAAARARLALPPDAVLVLFPHAVDVATKRVWLAEAAVECLRERHPTAELWIVNGRPADDMPLYYGAADVVIVTSLLEGGPSCVKEALACGVPVVSVWVGDTDLFAEAPRAMIRAEATPEGLAAGLATALERSRGERTSHLPGHLRIDVAARAIVDVYENAVSVSGPQASR